MANETISIEDTREAEELLRAEVDAKMDMIDTGFAREDELLEMAWSGSYLVRNRVTKEMDHGPLKSIAASMPEAIGNHYLDLMDEYPPSEGWESPSIIMDPEPMGVLRINSKEGQEMTTFYLVLESLGMHDKAEEFK